MERRAPAQECVRRRPHCGSGHRSFSRVERSLSCVVLAPKSGGSPDVGSGVAALLGFVRSRRLNRLAVHELECSSPRLGAAWSICLGTLWARDDRDDPFCRRRARAFMAWAVLLLLAWQLHHFQKQNLGQVALTGASLGLASLRRGERTAICTTGAAGIAEVCAHPGLLQLDVRLPLQWVPCAFGDSAPCRRCRRWNSGLDQTAQVPPPTEVLRHVRVGAALSAPCLRVHLAVRRRRRPHDGARPPVPAARSVSSQPATIAGSGSVGWLRCARWQFWAAWS